MKCFLCFLVLVSSCSLAVADDAEPSTLESLHKTLELTGGKMDVKSPCPVGTEITFQFAIKNKSSKTLHRPEMTSSTPRPSEIGIEQAWIERLGRDSTIAVMPKNVARDGKRYGASGYTITFPESLKGGAAIDLFARKVDTKGYPPGKYRMTMEFRDSKNKVLQSKSIEFELTK